MYLAMAEKRGYDVKQLRGTAQNDILKEFIGRGTWIFPVEPSIRLVGDTIEYCAEHAPKYSPVSVCGYHIRESGATPAQEMAYAFCIAKAYADDVLAARPARSTSSPGGCPSTSTSSATSSSRCASSAPAAACGRRS